MSISVIQAIDVHAHVGVSRFGQNALVDKLQSADAAKIIARANKANTRWTIVSPLESLSPMGKANTFGANEQTWPIVAETEGLLQWAVLNPLEEQTFEQVERMLKQAKCVGIKIHPEAHGYHIKQQGRVIFEFAAKQQAIVQTHSGEENSRPEDFVPFVDDFPEVKLILGHIGCSSDDNDPTHQIRAVKASKHGNIYADTSSSQSIISGLIEYAVEQIGPERILYGTDSPLYFAPMQRARIDSAEISEQAKRLILHDNAEELFGLD